MSGRQRMSRWTLLLDTHTAKVLAERARAHGVSRPAYARAVIVGKRPGGMPGQVASVADNWWDTLPPSRRAQVHGWLTAGGRGHDGGVHPDQLAMFDTQEGSP